LIAHLGIDGAELVLRVDAMLLAQGKEVLALHVKLARQRENADFLFLLLQAELPVIRLSRHTFSPDNRWRGLPSHHTLTMRVRDRYPLFYPTPGFRKEIPPTLPGSRLFLTWEKQIASPVAQWDKWTADPMLGPLAGLLHP
jgi:hypothetical protein